MPTFIAILFVLLAALIQGAEAAPAEYRPQGSVRDYFLGAWKLVSTEDRYPDGHTSAYPGLGPDALGFLIYAASGHMCAQLMKRQRSPWAAGDKPTPQEAVAALDGFTSYCGIFELNESEHTMVHRPRLPGLQTGWAPCNCGPTTWSARTVSSSKELKKKSKRMGRRFL